MSKNQEVQELKSKITQGIIMFCKLRQEAINNGLGDCGTDEKGKCIGYAGNADEPHGKCKECRASVNWEE